MSRRGWGSSLVIPWPSCKSKTKKGHYLLAIVALHQLDYISYNYICGLLHCSSKNTVTALLQYLDLNCSIRVHRITATDDFRGAKPPILFFTGAAAPLAPLLRYS